MFGDNKMINNGKCIIASVKITVFKLDVGCSWAKYKLSSVTNRLIPLVCQEFCRVNSVFISPAIHICSAFFFIHNVEISDRIEYITVCVTTRCLTITVE